MIENTTLGRLKEGDAQAISFVMGELARRSLTQADITRVWESLVEGLQGNGDRMNLLDFASRLCSIPQDPEILKMYEDLVSLNAYSKMGYAPAISIGAALARISQGEVPGRLDKRGREKFVSLAKDTLFRAIEKGGEDTRKYAAEGLRHLKSPDVRMGLANVARTSSISALKEAAGDSIAFIRTNRDLEDAREDREFLLQTGYPDPASPQRLYIECVFSAVETVLGGIGKAPKDDIGMEVAVKQLSAFGACPGEIGGLFEGKNDKHNLRTMMKNVENALLYALTNGPKRGIREEAARGLEKIGSDYVEEVLDRIASRCGEDHQTGAIASEALSNIRGKKTQVFEVAPLPPPRRSQPPGRQKLIL